MIGVADGDGQGVGVVGGRLGARQQHGDHGRHLSLVRAAGSHDGFFDQTRGVFAHGQTGARRRQHGRRPRLAQLERAARIGGDELVFDGRFMGLMLVQKRFDRVMDEAKPARHHVFGRRFDDAMGDKRQARAVLADHAPAGGVQAGINPKDSNRCAHCGQHSALGGEGAPPDQRV